MAKTIALGVKTNADSVVPIISPALTVIFLAMNRVLHFRRQRNWRTCFFIGNDAIMSDTPRADALMFIPTWKEAVVPASNYRELERELAAVKKDRDEWKAKAEANARDAERYRWLRDDWWMNDDPEELQPDLDMVRAETAEQFDAAVDAAMRKKEK